MGTTLEYDLTVERLRRERNDKEIQPIRADSPYGKAALAALSNASERSIGPKKSGLPKGKKRGPRKPKVIK